MNIIFWYLNKILWHTRSNLQLILQRTFIVISVCLVIILSIPSPAIAHSPHDDIDQLDISPAYSADQTVLITVRNNLLRSSDGGASWSRLTNGLDNRYKFSNIAISPSNQRVVFVSSNGDGIYKSNNGGDSWARVNNGLNSLDIDSVVIDHFSSDVAIALTQNGTAYRTFDGGNLWQEIAIGNTPVTTIAVFQNSSERHWLAGDQKGNVYLSKDDGDTWKRRFSLPRAGAVTAIATLKQASQDSVIFLGTEKGGLFKAKSNGKSLVKSSQDIPDKFITSIVLSPNYENDKTVFSSTWGQAVFSSKDGGNTWQKNGDGISKSSQANKPRYKSPHFKHLKISDNFKDDNTLFLAGYDGLFKSVDYGSKWVQMQTLTPSLIMSFALSPIDTQGDFTVGVGTYRGGFYIKDEQTDKWIVGNKNLPVTRLRDIAFSPDYASDETVFAPVKQVILRSEDRGYSWQAFPIHQKARGMFGKITNFLRKIYTDFEINLGRKTSDIVHPTEFIVSPNFASDKTLYFGTSYNGLYKSVDRGESWSKVWNAKGLEVKSLIISPNFAKDKTLYASINEFTEPISPNTPSFIYKTTNGGRSWSQLKSALDSLNGRLYLAISPNYEIDKTLFAATFQGLFKTEDAGKNWQEIPNSIVKGKIIESIAISPNYQKDSSIIVSVKGRGLFKSNDGGNNFTQIGNDLRKNNISLSDFDSFPAESSLIKFSSNYKLDKTIYGSSTQEIFRSKDSGKTWELIKRPVRYENNLSEVDYEGSWEEVDSKQASALKINQSDTKGSQVSLRFLGTGIRWIGETSPENGIAKIFLDDQFKDEVSQFSKAQKHMTSTYAITGLSYGLHKILIEVAGASKMGTSGHRVSIDAFDVIP